MLDSALGRSKYLNILVTTEQPSNRSSSQTNALRMWYYAPWPVLESSWNVMTHGDTQEGKWRGNWWMEWVASTLHTTSEHGVSSITTADAHTSPASPFCRKTKSVFCACAITFQMQSTTQGVIDIRHNFKFWGVTVPKWHIVKTCTE